MNEIVRLTKTGISVEMSHWARGMVYRLIWQHLAEAQRRRNEIKVNGFNVLFPRLLSQALKKDWHPTEKGKIRMRMSEAEGLAVMWLIADSSDVEIMLLKDKLCQKLLQ